MSKSGWKWLFWFTWTTLFIVWFLGGWIIHEKNGKLDVKDFQISNLELQVSQLQEQIREQSLIEYELFCTIRFEKEDELHELYEKKQLSIGNNRKISDHRPYLNNKIEVYDSGLRKMETNYESTEKKRGE